MYIHCTDSSVDCNFHEEDSSKSPYVIVIVVSLAVALVVLVIVILLYLFYRRHSKKSSNFVQLHNENDHHDNNTIDDQATTIQPAQEAGSTRDQLQVDIGLTTPSESSQSKSTLEEMVDKKLRDHYQLSMPAVAGSAGKQRSSLAGLQNRHSNLFETVA